MNTDAMTLWLTGRPCAGKSTLAEALEQKLKKAGIRVARLDGDDLRSKMNADLGFSESDRKENLRRAAQMAQVFNDNGSCVIAAFVSPTHEMRRMVRGIVRNFKLCYVQCGAEVCESRDVKGMYKKARQGKIKDFTGVSAPFEEPRDAEIVVDTEHRDLEQCVEEVFKTLEIQGRPERS